MKLYAYAKINWTLDIVGRREDGYHLLDMLMQSVELHDTLTISAADTLSLALASGSPWGRAWAGAALTRPLL